MPVEYAIMETGGPLGGEPVQAKVVEDQQVRRQEGPEGALQGVVDSGLGYCPEVVVGMLK